MYAQKAPAILPEVIDSTMVGEFVACPTKFYYSFCRQLGPVYPSIDLHAGGAFARGLEVLRKAYYGPEKLSLAASLERAMLEAMAFFGDVVVPDFKEAKGVDRVVTALAAYIEHFPPATDHIQPNYGSDGNPMVEFTFSVPLPIKHPTTGNPFIYAGRFDMVGLYNGQLLGVDEKTTSQLGPTWSSKWNLRGQFTGYCWALHQFDLPVVGMVARGISFLKKSHGFEESIQMRPKWMIDQWYEQLLRNVERMSAAWTSGWFDQDFGETCAAYSGCPFQILCQSATPEDWIHGRFGKREWNPLHKIPEKHIEPTQAVETVNVASEVAHLFK
jgi:hypothetical protein